MSNFGGVSVGRALQRRWPMIAILAIVSVAAASWVSFGLLTKKYQATTTLLVQPLMSAEKISYDEIMTNERLAVTYGEIIKSHAMARRVIESLKLEMTETRLLRELTVSPVKNSLVLAIEVTDPDPSRAMQIADAFASSFVSSLPGIMHVENVAVLDEARFTNNGNPVSPKPVFLMGAAFLLAINTGVGASILLEFLDRTVEDEDAVEQILGAPVLSVIPRYATPTLIADGNHRSRRKVPCLDDPRSEVTESFRALRTNIRQIPFDEEVRSILITSPQPLDGKTSVSAGLAMCLAQEGRKVLLMDCDLRHPAVHEVFDIPNETGLATVISSGLAVTGAIVATGLAGLEVLPAGPAPADPGGILSKSTFAALLSSLRGSYDMVLVDSPPLLPVADAQILGKLCDGVLLVVKAGSTQVEGVRRSKNLLLRVGARIIGGVLNAEKINPRGYYGYYNHHE